jgi:hypothetical protein
MTTQRFDETHACVFAFTHQALVKRFSPETSASARALINTAVDLSGADLGFLKEVV